MGYSPWGRRESDTTERLHFHFQDDIICLFHFSFQEWIVKAPRDCIINGLSED